MGVRKIFIILITIVACVVLGAFVLNILMPNTTTALVNSVESMIFNATGMTFDFNGDGTAGDGRSDFSNDTGITDGGSDEVTTGVNGFSAGGGN